MGKKIALLLVAVVVTVGLVGAAVYLRNNPEFGSKPEESDTESISSAPVYEAIYILGGTDRVPASRVNIHNQNGEFVALAGTADRPATIEGLEAFALQEVDSLLSHATTLLAKSSVGTEGNLKDFGLDNPQATITISYENQSSATLLLGNPVPGGNGIYAKLENNDEIFVANTSSTEAFLRRSLDFVGLQITGGSAETSIFTKVVLGGSSRPEEIVIDILPEEEMTQTSGFVLNSHRITSPVQVNLDTRQGNEVLDTMFGLVADQVVAVLDENTILADYGLEEPYSTIAATAAEPPQAAGQEIQNLSFALSLSAPDASGNVYFIKEGTALIYQVAQEKLPWLSKNHFDMMSKLIVLPFINKVETISIEAPDKTTVFDLELKVTKKDDGTDSEDVTISIDGRPLDTKGFKQFYQTLISTQFDTDVEKDFAFDPDSATKLLTLTYQYREGGQDVLTFYESAARRTLVSLNGNTPKYILSTQLERIIEDTAKVAAGEIVTAR